MGERTWGKGSVQNVIELEDGRSALKLTTAAYCRPSGKNIHRFPDSKESDEWGVMPDAGYDLRLERQRDGGAVGRSPGPRHCAARIRRPQEPARPSPMAKPAAGRRKTAADGKPAREATRERRSIHKPCSRTRRLRPRRTAGASRPMPSHSTRRTPRLEVRMRPFVDRQLQMAHEVSDRQLARAK